MNARGRPRRFACAHLASIVLTMAMTGGCERSSRGQSSAANDSPHARATTAPRSLPRDAAPPFVPADTPWRRALDEVVRRIDRGDPPARIAEVFGTVSTFADGGVAITSTLPGASRAAITFSHGQIHISLLMTPRLHARELEAGAGPCEEFPLLEEDGQLICPPFKTQRGTMRIRGLIDGEGSDETNLVVDYLEFDWAPDAVSPDARHSH